MRFMRDASGSCGFWTNFRRSDDAVKTGLLILCCILGLLGEPFPASAELGGDSASVYRDVDHANGSVQVTNESRYLIFEIKTGTGTVVREFLSPDGTVFAISWEGRFIPELHQFLGAYFDEYSKAVKAQTKSFLGRRRADIHLPGLVFESKGHMGWYSGRAYIPQSVPKQANLEDIH